jgi:predicted oxidoreductase
VVITYNFVGLLEALTGKKGWREVSGLDSRCGLDYWYEDEDETVAYINIDQNMVTVSVDAQLLLESDEDSDFLHKFVTRS